MGFGDNDTKIYFFFCYAVALFLTSLYIRFPRFCGSRSPKLPDKFLIFILYWAWWQEKTILSQNLYT
ncbi:MAG: hypothetical protein DA408_19140 [Bacteroidetes bacterium]|nr:MAG: hypothetical protein DA408_19140 [Bacteroidota bacterium]